MLSAYPADRERLGPADAKVYELRWNQVGGPELLTTEHHKGEGCTILFGDGHVKFIKAEELKDLKWE